jgi:hypothetical protein
MSNYEEYLSSVSLKAEPGNEHKNNNEKMRTIKLTNSRDLHNLLPIALYYTLRRQQK